MQDRQKTHRHLANQIVRNCPLLRMVYDLQSFGLCHVHASLTCHPDAANVQRHPPQANVSS
eukprot:6473370-Amphidinium_carterae.2